MSEDATALRRYAREGSEQAFAQVVERNLPLVYSAALRQVGGDEQLAKDVAQGVFVALAHQASRVCRREWIAGWLFITTRNIAAKLVRADRRRLAREKAAVAMQALDAQPHAEPDWNEVRPILDEAMTHLAPADLNAVLLRFFDGKDLKTLGATLGISEDAARMRVNRAVENLRGLLRQRGVVVSAALLGGVLGSQAVGAVPAGLTASITATAVASSAAAGTFLKAFLMTKLKMGIVTAVVVVGAATPWVIQRQTQTRLQAEVQELRLKSEQMDSLVTENARLSNEVAQVEARQSGLDESSELLRLRGEVGRLRQEAEQAQRLRAENRRLQSAAARQKEGADSKLEQLDIQLPKASWAFAGYGTPEDALQTVMWALREGDLKSLVASLTPSFVEKAQKAWGEKFEEELKAELPGNLEKITDCRIVEKQAISDTEARLFYSLCEPPRSFGEGVVRQKALGCAITAKRVGQEWKLEP